jgi:hypothetical protein
MDDSNNKNIKVTSGSSFFNTSNDLIIYSNYLYYISYFLYFLVVVLLSIVYWNSKLGQDATFQTYVQVLMAATIIMTVYSVYLQQATIKETSDYDQVNTFDNNFKELLDDTVKFFIDNPDMNYYYQELFYNESNYTEDDRNKDLETQITLVMLSRISNVIYTIYVYGNKFKNEDAERVIQSEEILVNILSSFFKSKIFNENWEKYKSGLSPKITIQFMNKHFNK